MPRCKRAWLIGESIRFRWRSASLNSSACGNNEMFAKHSWYFRNALVRANYRNIQKGIDYSPIYLVRFFRNLLLKDGWVLKNRYLHIRPTDEWKEQPNLNFQTGSGQKNNFINKEGEENVPSLSQVRPK